MVLKLGYDPTANPRFQTAREFQARVVMLDRNSILTEQSVGDFAKEHGFRMVPEDHVATNPNIHFRVETFAPAEGFTPRKPYVTRLLWRDLDGNDQSKLLLTRPEEALAICVRGEPVDAKQTESAQPNQRRLSRNRTRRPRIQPPSASA
jgi:hypothetical protein